MLFRSNRHATVDAGAGSNMGVIPNRHVVLHKRHRIDDAVLANLATCIHYSTMHHDGARADSVPNLEIETGKIEGAGHASASGRFDDEQLFYLMSRGIDEDQAKKLVVRGFLSEVIQKTGIESIEQRLISAIEAELEKAGA